MKTTKSEAGRPELMIIYRWSDGTIAVRATAPAGHIGTFPTIEAAQAWIAENGYRARVQ